MLRSSSRLQLEMDPIPLAPLPSSFEWSSRSNPIRSSIRRSKVPSDQRLNVSFTTNPLQTQTYDKLALIRRYCNKERETLLTEGDPCSYYPMLSSKFMIIWTNGYFEDDVGAAFDGGSLKLQRPMDMTAPFDDNEYLRLVRDIAFIIRYDKFLNL